MNKVIEKDIYELVGNSDSFVDNLRNTTVMVTGANGLIAKYYIYYLCGLNKYKNLNIKIVAGARSIEKAKNNFSDCFDDENFSLIEQDVLEPLQYEGNVDYIIHTAGQASAYFIVNDPVGIMKANTIGTINVLEFAKEKSVKNLLFTSTREIYGKLAHDVTLIKESEIGSIDTLDSRSCYPESKRVSETLLKAYNKQFDVPFVVTRIAHTYGPTMTIKNDGRVMSDFINFIVNGENIVLNSDGSAKRSFCYITDTVYGMTVAMLKGKIGEAYNLANEQEPYPIRETAQKLVSLYPEKQLEVKYKEADEATKQGYNKIPLVQMDTSKLEDLGWEPKVPLKDGLKRTVDFYEEEKEKDTAIVLKNKSNIS